jgi:hypothetical protein
VTSQVITIDDLTSDVAGIACGAVSLCRVEAHAAAVSKAGSQNELVPNLRAGLEASGIETGIAALLKSRADFAEADAEGETNLDRGALTSHRPDDWGHCCSCEKSWVPKYSWSFIRNSHLA